MKNNIRLKKVNSQTVAVETNNRTIDVDFSRTVQEHINNCLDCLFVHHEMNNCGLNPGPAGLLVPAHHKYFSDRNILQ